MLWERLLWPLARLIVFISLGLLVANFIEALNWTRWIGLLARPLARLGNMSDTTSASFSMAIFSGLAANTLLAESYDKGQLSRRELVIANLFNSFPTYFTHLPTIFFITFPLIHGAAFVYVGMTVAAAVLRTLSVVLIGRLFLAAPEDQPQADVPAESRGKSIDWQAAMEKSWKRFRRRIRKSCCIPFPSISLSSFCTASARSAILNSSQPST